MNEFKFHPFERPFLQLIIKQMTELYNTNTTPFIITYDDGTIKHSFKWNSQEAEEAYNQLDKLYKNEMQELIKERAKTFRHFPTA